MVKGKRSMLLHFPKHMLGEGREWASAFDVAAGAVLTASGHRDCKFDVCFFLLQLC